MCFLFRNTGLYRLSPCDAESQPEPGDGRYDEHCGKRAFDEDDDFGHAFHLMKG